jgi:hypothetical protein
MITFRNSSVRKERFAPGGKVYIRASAPFHDRHCNEMGSTLDRNDNQGTDAFLALVHGRDHSSGPGIGANAEMLFQIRTRLLSQRRYVDSSLLIALSVSQRQTGGNRRRAEKGARIQ